MELRDASQQYRMANKNTAMLLNTYAANRASANPKDPDGTSSRVPARNATPHPRYNAKRDHIRPAATTAWAAGPWIAITAAVNKFKTRVGHPSRNPAPYRDMMNGLRQIRNNATGITAMAFAFTASKTNFFRLRPPAWCPRWWY